MKFTHSLEAKMNNLTTLYLARHGQTDWNTQSKLQGHTDIPLNEVGEQQARELAAELKNIKFDQIFSSDLLRAKKTAEIIALEHNLVVESTQLLREVTYGKFEGFNSKEFFDLFIEWQQLTDEEKKKHKHASDFDTIESRDDISSRLLTFLRETALAFPGQNILVVSHGGVMINLLIHLGYAQPKREIHVKNTAYIKLESDGIEFFIKEVKGVEIN